MQPQQPFGIPTAASDHPHFARPYITTSGSRSFLSEVKPYVITTPGTCILAVLRRHGAERSCEHTLRSHNVWTAHACWRRNLQPHQALCRGAACHRDACFRTRTQRPSVVLVGAHHATDCGYGAPIKGGFFLSICCICYARYVRYCLATRAMVRQGGVRRADARRHVRYCPDSRHVRRIPGSRGQRCHDS
jgi:hypothetical protein